MTILTSVLNENSIDLLDEDNLLLQQTLLSARKKVQQYLEEFAASSDFIDKMRLAFGDRFPIESALSLTQDWGKDDWLPSIRILPSATLKGAYGAFSKETNTIYLAQEYVQQNAKNPRAIVDVLLEEIGHFVDAQINFLDSSGDEGAIFAALVQGKRLDDEELRRLRGEDDTAVISLDGQEIQIEQAAKIKFLGTGDVASKPEISGSNVVWMGNDGNDYEIYFWNGSEVKQLTNNSFGDFSPQISGSNVVWGGGEYYDSQIYFWNGSEVKQLTNGGDYNWAAQISGSNVVWGDGEYYDSQIYLWNGSEVKQLTNGGYNLLPQISGSNVVWMGEESYDPQIFNPQIYLWNGSEVKQLTNGGYNWAPQISGSNVVWESYDGNDSEIYLWNGSEVKQLTNNSFGDFSPQISGSNVVWESYGGNDYEIYLWNGSEVKQLTNNSFENVILQIPQISGSNVVWMGNDGNDYEIYFWNGTSVTQLTDNYSFDYQGEISGSNVVWTNDNFEGGRDIFLYTGDFQPVKVTITESDNKTQLIEGSGTDSYTIILDSQPTADITITIAPDIQSTTDLTTITFTPSNWNIPQTITVAAAEDSEEEGIHTSTITHTVSSADPKYNNLQAGSVTATLSDIKVSVEDSWVALDIDAETATIKFLVSLSKAATEEVRVEYSTLDGTALSTEKDYNPFSFLKKGTLIFNPGEVTKEIELTVFGDESINHTIFEILSRDTAYRDWKIGQDNDWIDNRSPYGDIGYRVDEFWNDVSTGFQAVGLTSNESFFLLLSNPTNAVFATTENPPPTGSNPLLDELTEILDPLNEWNEQSLKIWQDAEAAIQKLEANTIPWTFATGSIYDQAKDPVLAIRGTEPNKFLDLLTDLDHNGIGYKQFQANFNSAGNSATKQYSLNSWLSDISQAENGQIAFTPNITGHSLGGALTQWAGANYTGQLNEIVTFNSPGIPEAEALKFNPNNADSVTHYVTEGDLVSMAGEEYLPGNVTLSSFLKSSLLFLLDKHTLPVITDSIYLKDDETNEKPINYDFSTRNISSQELSSDRFNYFPNIEYLLLQLIVAGAGNKFKSGFGTELSIALNSRKNVEAKRQEIGKVIFDGIQILETTGRLSLPDVVISIGGDFDSEELITLGEDSDALLTLSSKNLELFYAQQPQKVFQIQGQVSATVPFLKDAFQLEKSLTAIANFTDNKYIKISNQGIDVVGEFALQNIPIIPNIWELKETKLFIDTERNQFNGTTKVLFPFGIEVNTGLEFVQDPTDKSWDFNYISIVQNNMNEPVGTTGLFLLKIVGQISNITLSAPQLIQFNGELDLAASARISASLPSWAGGGFSGSLVELNLNGSLNKDRIKADGNIKILGGLLQGNGQAELNWTQGFLSAEANFSALGGLISTHSRFKATSNLDITMAGGAKVVLPEIFPWYLSFLDNLELASADFLLQFSNDQNSSNDFIAGWGSTPIIGKAGLQVFLNGDWEFLGAGEIDALPRLSSQTMLKSASQSVFAAESLTSLQESFSVTAGTPWLLLGANWENGAADVPIELQAPDGTIYTEADIAASQIIKFVPVSDDPTSKLVSITNPGAGVWTIRLLDADNLSNVEFAAIGGHKQSTVEITDLTQDTLNKNVMIDYAFESETPATVNLFYDTDNQGFDGILLAEGLTGTNGASNYAWQTEGVTTGTYYVYAVAVSENGIPVFSYSQEQVPIGDRPPINGTDGNDTLSGTEGNDVINGNNGNDYIEGLASDDSIDGGTGNFDRMFGGIGNDTIVDPDGVLGSHGGSGNDTISVIFAAGWDNDANPGNSPRSDGKITGGYGDDLITVTMNNSKFFINFKGDEPVSPLSNHPQDGNDVITLLGTYGNSVVDLGGGNDIFNGGDGNDNVSGSSGHDTIMGAAGNDRLVGGTDNDTLTGGRGSDRFVFDTMTAFAATEIGLDTIKDFSSTDADRIALDKTTFQMLTSIVRKTSGFSNSNEFTVVNDDLVASISEALIIYNSTNGNLFYNPNGSDPGLGDGGLFAKLTNAPLLAATDFVIQT